MKPNFANRTMWTGDNLDILRGMNSECVDLIYLDPPFNSNRNYSAPVGSEAAGAAFKDTWTLDDIDLAWHGEIADREPALYAVINAARTAHGKSMMSYTIMMAVRLMKMRRVLKPTGSIYLHCDPTANAYLQLLMNAIYRDSYRASLIPPLSAEERTNDMAKTLKQTLVALTALLTGMLISSGCDNSQTTLDEAAVGMPAPELNASTAAASPDDAAAFMDMLKGAGTNGSGMPMAPPEQVYAGERDQWAKEFQGRWKLTSSEIGGYSLPTWTRFLDIHPVGTENPDHNKTNQAFPTLNLRTENDNMGLAIVWYMLWNIDEERKVLVLLTRSMSSQNPFRDALHGEEQVWQFHEVGYTETTVLYADGVTEPKRGLRLRTHTVWGRSDGALFEYVGPSPTD